MDIDWPTKVITVYKTDPFMSLVSGYLYNMDTNAFRLALKAEEDGEIGMAYPDITLHNTEVTLGGITYARTFQIINGYTVIFDDTGGGWVANLVGSNNNILDVTTLSAVQVKSNNSAGLQIVTQGSGITEQDKDDIANKSRDVILSTTDQSATPVGGIRTHTP